MQRLITIAVISLTLVTACATPQQRDEVIFESSSSHHYLCKSGAKIGVSYPSSDLATLIYQGQAHLMQIAVSGSGARYLGDNLEWWTKGAGLGSQGTLLERFADGTSGEISERCVESAQADT